VLAIVGTHALRGSLRLKAGPLLRFGLQSAGLAAGIVAALAFVLRVGFGAAYEGGEGALGMELFRPPTHPAVDLRELPSPPRTRPPRPLRPRPSSRPGVIGGGSARATRAVRCRTATATRAASSWGSMSRWPTRWRRSWAWSSSWHRWPARASRTRWRPSAWTS